MLVTQSKLNTPQFRLLTSTSLERAVHHSLLVPVALMWRELDWHLRWYQVREYRHDWQMAY